MLELGELFYYPNLSPGFLGLNFSRSTANSGFLGTLSSQLEIRSALAVPAFPFPQRVPRPGFFEELNELESEYFREQFKIRRNEVMSLLKELCAEGSIQGEREYLVLNLMEFAVRIGELRAIAFLPAPAFENLFCQLESRLKIQTYRISHQVSHDSPPELEPLRHLLTEVPREAAFDYLRAVVIARLVVATYRYSRNQEDRAFANQQGEFLRKFAEQFQPSNLKETIHLSMMWRALPMLSTVASAERETLMKRSIAVAEGIQPAGARETSIKSDLLTTTCQSLAKFYKSSGQNLLAVEQFHRMIDLDPYDSVPHSEFGLHWFNQNNFSAAIPLLERAVELGPPGTALNLYYLGRAYQKMNRIEEALSAWARCSRVDQVALSPLLDSFYLHLELGNLSNARNLRDRILFTRDLDDQLSEDERVSLQGI